MWPFGSASLLESGGADRVRVATHEHRQAGLRLLAKLFLERASDVPDQGLLVRSDRALRQLRDLAGELHRALERPPSGTTSLASPIRSASSASTGRPVTIISIARPQPTTRGRRTVIPSPATMFQRLSRAPKTAISATIRMSASRAFSSPAATAQPFTAATTGLNTSARRV